MMKAPASLTDMSPSDQLLVLYAPLVQNFLDGNLTSVAAPAPSLSPPAHPNPLPASVDPATVEKIRLILLSAAEFWYFISANAYVKADLQRVITVLSDPAQWQVIANLFFGPPAGG